MAFIPVQDTVQAVLEYGNGTLEWTNTLWFRKPGFTEVEQQQLADELGLWAVNNLIPNYWTGWGGQLLTVYDMSSPTAPKKFSTQFNLNGSVAGSEAPLSIALVVTFYTAARGRSGRGRNYVTGFVEADTSANAVINAVRVTNIQQAYTTLRTSMLALGWEWVVVQRYELGAPLPAGVPRPVTSEIVRSAAFGSQRRRVPRP